VRHLVRISFKLYFSRTARCSAEGRTIVDLGIYPNDKILKKKKGRTIVDLGIYPNDKILKKKKDDEKEEDEKEAEKKTKSKYVFQLASWDWKEVIKTYLGNV
jgi:hypothetical protein